MQVINMNALTLAYIGDAIYEVYIRKYLVDKGIVKVNDLQKNAVNYVSAKNQSRFLKEMIDNNFFNEQEISVIMRARNNKGSSHPKNTDIITYKHATALEAVIGYLYLDNQKNRIDEIMNYILGE
jgi:ribonuclease-3 family protein